MEDKQEKAEKELFALYKKTKDPERDHNAVSVHSQNHGNETI